ncbi:MAG: hypothetical protein C4K60_21245 [Ideonella sp. MAG2]|nr:MAG: hypothetical protein C4K60_21245 [Ideonella sp. MAG2]
MGWSAAWMRTRASATGSSSPAIKGEGPSMKRAFQSSNKACARHRGAGSRPIGCHCGVDPCHALSGGQQQRLALARAWALQPDILFLDEPTASLDPSAKREVESLIAEFGQDGVSVVMSTHNLGQAKRLASHVAYLEAGQLVVQRPVDAFFNDTLPEAAAQFLKGELPWT